MDDDAIEPRDTPSPTGAARSTPRPSPTTAKRPAKKAAGPTKAAPRKAAGTTRATSARTSSNGTPAPARRTEVAADDRIDRLLSDDAFPTLADPDAFLPMDETGRIALPTIVTAEPVDEDAEVASTPPTPVESPSSRDDRSPGPDQEPQPMVLHDWADESSAELPVLEDVAVAEVLDDVRPRGLRAPAVIRRSRRPRVRRVTRVIRQVDTWSVFKVALVFSLFLYAVLLTAGVLLWKVAQNTGTIDNVQRFMESFGWKSFTIKGGAIYHQAWVAGLFVVIGLTGLAVLGATLFNLITDLVGGIRVTVLEEEVVAREEQVPGWRRARRARPEPMPVDLEDPADRIDG